MFSEFHFKLITLITITLHLLLPQNSNLAVFSVINPHTGLTAAQLYNAIKWGHILPSSPISSRTAAIQQQKSCFCKKKNAKSAFFSSAYIS